MVANLGLWLRNLNVAYPSTLGDDLPEPPFGYCFITDDDGAYLLDDNNYYLVVEWNG